MSRVGLSLANFKSFLFPWTWYFRLRKLANQEVVTVAAEVAWHLTYNPPYPILLSLDIVPDFLQQEQIKLRLSVSL